jgi:hypothetical protein
LWTKWLLAIFLTGPSFPVCAPKYNLSAEAKPSSHLTWPHVFI